MNRRKRLHSTQTVRHPRDHSECGLCARQALILAALIVWLFDAPVRPAY